MALEGTDDLIQLIDELQKSNPTKHYVNELLVISLLATLAGDSSYESLGQFAMANFKVLREFLRLKGGPPNRHDFAALFDALDPKQVESALECYTNPMMKALSDDRLTINVSAFLGSFEDVSKRSPLHRVQVFLPGVGLAFGQAKVDGKSNETTAMPGVLDILNLVERTVTVYSPHTRRDISAQIVEKGGAFVIPVAHDRHSLHEDVQLLFENPEALKEMHSYQRDDGWGYKRNETRKATVSDDVGRLQERHEWPELKTVGMIETVRKWRGQTKRTVRHFVMSREITPEHLMDLTRHHWEMNNRFRWVLDVVADKDRIALRQ